MTSPMAPDQASDHLDFLISEGAAPYNMVRHALETIAAMRVEEDWRIVPTDSNGGKYQTRRHTRLVSEWVAG